MTIRNVNVTDGYKNKKELEEAFEYLWDLTSITRDNGGIIYFIGNGASSTMSSHFAIDFLKIAKCRAHCFTDDALITAIGNDIGFDEIFSLPLQALLNDKDLLIAISRSGNSPNIIKVVKMAKSKKCTTVSLSPMGENNQLRLLGDLNFYVPAKTYGHAETAHQLLLHCWLDKYM